MQSTRKLGNPKQAVAIPAVGVIGIVIVIGVLASLVLVSNLDSPATTTLTTTTTTNSTTTPTLTSQTSTSSSTTANASTASTVTSASALNAEQIYAAANRSIVTLEGSQNQNSYLGEQQVSVLGTGFVIQYSGSYYIATNYHVAGSTSNLTATFSNGDSYPAKVVGSDPYADLAIVSVPTAPISEFYPLTLVSSSSLHVGDSIVAIGDPYGLTGSMTQGIISQLGRTIQDETAGNFSIANVIQFSAPINPGNSGGPLLNSEAQVVGITTATVSSSQGVGFAIPSDTITKELPSLIASGTYSQHAYLGIGSVDMNYVLSQATGSNVTYGILVENVVSGGPAASAGLKAGTTTITVNGQQYLIGGDIIVSINGTRIINTDALATYLAENTVAGQTISVGIVRAGNVHTTLDVTLGTRPSISP